MLPLTVNSLRVRTCPEAPPTTALSKSKPLELRLSTPPRFEHLLSFGVWRPGLMPPHRNICPTWTCSSSQILTLCQDWQLRFSIPRSTESPVDKTAETSAFYIAFCCKPQLLCRRPFCCHRFRVIRLLSPCWRPSSRRATCEDLAAEWRVLSQSSPTWFRIQIPSARIKPGIGLWSSQGLPKEYHPAAMNRAQQDVAAVHRDPW